MEPRSGSPHFINLPSRSTLSSYFCPCFKIFIKRLAVQRSSRTPPRSLMNNVLAFHLSCSRAVEVKVGDAIWASPPGDLRLHTKPFPSSGPQSESSPSSSSSELASSSSDELDSPVLGSEIIPSELSISIEVSDMYRCTALDGWLRRRHTRRGGHTHTPGRGGKSHQHTRREVRSSMAHL